MRVIALPVILCLIVAVVYCFERRHNTAKARTHAKGNMFFAVFFCYPTVCTVSFAAFMCQQMSPTHWLLEADDNILCSDPAHRVILALSGVVIALFAFGLPVTFGYILLRAAHSYKRQTGGTNALLARRVAEDLKVDQVAAEFVIRDVIIGGDYSFLMDACASVLLSLRFD